MLRSRSPHRIKNSSSTPTLGLAALACVTVASALAMLSGCDNQATITPYTNRFQAIEVVSAVPAKIDVANGNATPVCGAWSSDPDERPDGYVLSLGYKSFQRTDQDPDLSLRPGDKLSFRKVAGTAEEAATT